MSGDPVGIPESIPDMVRAFAAAHQRGWRLVVLHCSEEWVGLFREIGMRALPIGDEAVLCPATFCLEGRDPQGAPVGQPPGADGLHGPVAAPADLTDADRAAVERSRRSG